MSQVYSLLIRIAAEADAALLTELGTATFRETFAAENTAVDMTDYLGKTFTMDRLLQELSDPLATFLIAEIAGRPVGYAKLHCGEPDPSVNGANPIELVRLYVLAESIGQGVGAALMKACHQQATSQGFQTLWLGVWERNFRAINFYQKWGFTPVGSHLFQLGSDPQTDFILQKNLSVEQIGMGAGA